ncbi:hypothetical protein HAX54_009913, partial [Datura stramonium]|nr:hypothetical protein [Datura stramonium]
MGLTYDGRVNGVDVLQGLYGRLIEERISETGYYLTRVALQWANHHCSNQGIRCNE